MTLNVWGWNQGKDWVNGIEAFNKTQDDITVEYRGIKADEYNTVLQTGLSGSGGPDVLMLRSYGGLETVVSSDLILPLDGQVPEVEKFAQEALDGATSRNNGKLYGVPFAVQTANVIYRKDAFSSIGVEEPTTWDDFTALCDTVKSAGTTPLAMGYQESWMGPIYRDMFGAASYGGPDFADELLSGGAKFTDDRYTAANKVLLDLKTWMPGSAQGMPVADLETLFVSGDAAMYPGGIWELAIFAEGLDIDSLGIFLPPPVEGDTTFAMGYVDGSWGVSARIPDEKKDAAYQLLSYLAGTEYGTHMADTLLQVPCVPDVTPKNDLVAQAYSWFQKEPTPYTTYVNFDYGTPAGSSLEYEFLQKMLLRQIEPSQVGVEVEKGISQWFEPQK
ncbi:extracellular solute-binding protein [Brachybacterium alimentarium]|uniref:extracellular solute-binding protein n=1 Tax=Brachybacterium alimentarium TaxID=47845 RepID=UPI003FCFD8B3